MYKCIYVKAVNAPTAPTAAYQKSLIALENSVLFLSHKNILTSIFCRYLFISALHDVMGFVWASNNDLISLKMRVSYGMCLKLDIHPLEEMLNC